MNRKYYMMLLTLFLGMVFGFSTYAGNSGHNDFGYHTNSNYQTNSDKGRRSHNPLSNLQEQIDELQDQIHSLQETHQPVELTVDCAAGDTVTDALNSIAGSDAPAIINIVGICTETILVERDDVTIRGSSASDGFQAPAPDVSQTVVVERGASRVRLENLSITGGVNGIGVLHNSSVEADGLEISGVASTAVIAVLGSSAFVSNSYLHNDAVGVVGAISAHVSLSNTLIENNDFGAIAASGGSVSIRPIPLQGKDFHENTALTNVIRNNIIGVIAQNGGSVYMTGSTVEDNSFTGMLALAGGNFEFAGPDGNLNQIRNNGFHGVFLRENSNASFDDVNYSITGNGGFGIACEAGTAYVLLTGLPGSVTGNALGDVQSTCN